MSFNGIDLVKVREDGTLGYCLDTFFRYSSNYIQDKSIPHFFDGQLPTQRHKAPPKTLTWGEPATYRVGGEKLAMTLHLNI